MVRFTLFILLCFSSLGVHGQLPVRNAHPRILLDSLTKASLLTKKAANDADWLDLKAEADDYSTRDVLAWTPANVGVWNTDFIFYNYCGSSWDEAAMTLGLAHQLTKTNNPGANPTAYSDKLLQLADTMLSAYQAYPPCSGCPNMFLWNSSYATRHVGPVVGIIYDWCYDELGATRKAAMLAMMEDFFAYMRVPYNTYQNTVHPTGNYFFGNVMCAGYMGYASMYDSPEAQEMIDFARQRITGHHSGSLSPNDLAENWLTQSYLGGLPTSASDSYLGPASYTSAPQKDGMPVQGWGYSGETFSRLVDFLMIVKSATGENLRDSLQPFLENTSMAFAHALTPNRFQVDNSNDWGSFRGNLLSYGLPLKMAAITEGTPQGPYAQYFYENWIRPCALAATWNDGYPAASYEKLLYRNVNRPSTAFSYPPFHPALPDYTTTTVNIDKGLSKYYLRENWSDTATWCALNMSNAFYDDHDHHNAGHFQIVRGDSVDGDDLLLVGANEVGNGGQFGMNGIEGGTCYHMSSSLSNTLFFDDFHDYTEVNTNGYVVGGQSFYGTDEPTHQEQNAEFTYVRADLTSAYYRKGELADTVNRTLLYFYRGFLYLRDADLFLVYDRIRAENSSNVLGQYPKHLRWHFLEQPQVNGNNVTATMGNSKLFVHTVLPSQVSILAVNESNNPDNTFGPSMNYAFNTYSWRAEVSVPGNPLIQDILTVMQPSSSLGTEMTTAAINSTPQDMEGSLVTMSANQELILLNLENAQRPTPISATNYAFTWHASTMHTLVGMQPNATYQVSYNGSVVTVSLNAAGNETASPAGVLRFAVSLPNGDEEETNPTHHITAFPQPSNGLVTLSWSHPSGTMVRLEVFNAQGQLVAQNSDLAGKQQVQLTNLTPGSYIARFITKNGQPQYTKIVVMR